MPTLYLSTGIPVKIENVEALQGGANLRPLLALRPRPALAVPWRAADGASHGASANR